MELACGPAAPAPLRGTTFLTTSWRQIGCRGGQSKCCLPLPTRAMVLAMTPAPHLPASAPPRGRRGGDRLVASADAPAVIAADAPDGSAGGGATRPLDKLRILVVDDEVDARELFAMVLRSTGALVTVAGSVDEALAAFVDQRPDILVSDIGMPGQDGYSLIRRVRMLSAEAGGTVPAVALTAFTGPEHRARALDAGFTMHVPKPVDPDRLIAVATQLSALLRAR